MLVRLALDPWLDYRQPFIVVYLAVLLVSLHLGWRAGLVTLAIALPLCMTLFVPPSGWPLPGAEGDWLPAVFGTGMSAVIIAVANAQHAARLRAMGLAKQAGAAAESLRSSERRFRAMFDQAAVGIGNCDLQGRWTLANDRLCEILGAGRDELLGRSILVSLHPEELPARGAELERLLAGKVTSLDLESRYIRGDGSEVWVRLLLSVVHSGSGGGPAYLAAIVQDITPSKRARGAIEGSNQRLAILAQTAEDLLRAETPEHLLSVVFDRLSAYLRLEVYFHYRAGHGEDLELAAYHGVEEEIAAQVRQLRFGEHVCGTVAQTRTAYAAQGVQESADPRLEFVKSLGITAYVCYPLIARGRLIGTLSFGTRNGTSFDADSLALIRAVCDQVAVALDNAQLSLAQQESEERYRTLVEQVPDYAIFRVGLDNKPTSWNEGVWRVLGYEEEEFINSDLIEAIFLPEDIAEGVPYFELAEAARSGSASNDRWMRRKSGERFYANGITAALRDESGELIGFTKVMRDRTELYRAEEELKRSEERYRALSQATFDAILIHDDGRIIEVNHACEELFGYAREELLGQDALRMLVMPDSSAKARESIDRGSEEPYEAELRRRDGSTFIAEVRARAFVFQGRRVRMASARDISNRKRIEEELARHRDHLQEILRDRTAELEASHQQLRLSERLAALGTLAAGLGHDMGNLLLPLRSRLESIQSQVTDRAVLEDVEAIRKAAEYLQRLTHGLRLLAIDADEAQSRGHGTDLHDWWPDAEPLLRNALPGKVLLRHNFPEVPLRVTLARPGVTQAVFNLVQNAGQAMRGQSDGEVTVWAEPTRYQGGAAVRIGVTDNGPGMSPETVRRCLEPFYTTKTRTHATGMGLPLVHATVQKVGGALDVRSQPGHGATFIMTLPAASAEQEVSPSKRPHVAVSLHDQRMRSYIESLLRAADLEPLHGEPRDDECLWIADDRGANDESVGRFLGRDPRRRVVLFSDGESDREDGRVVVLGRDPKPLVIRQAIRGALAGCQEPAG